MSAFDLSYDLAHGADAAAELRHYAPTAEAAVLGAVLAYGPAAYDAAGLQAADFCLPLHQVLWRAVEALVLAGRHVDTVAVLDAVPREDWPYLHQLASGSAAVVRAVPDHARVVAELAKARALCAAARGVATLADDDALPVDQRVAQSVALLEAVVDDRAQPDAVPVADYAASFIDRLQALADGSIQPGRPTRIPGLDRLLCGGLRDGQLVIVAARPSVGKSSFAQQLALTHAGDGVHSAFFGMEMTGQELTNRAVANLGRVALGGIKTGRLSDDDWSRVSDGVEALRDLPFYLYDRPAMTLQEVAAKARRLVRRHSLKTLVVDYLQLMKGGGGKAERRTELEEITRGMKQLAKQLGITVLLLSQLNREVEKRSNPRPVMSDLKECGAIEEDADVILALWTHRKGGDGAADVKGCAVLKNRDGETGELALHFDGPYQRWSESTELLHAQPAPGRRTNTYADDF